MKRKTYLTSVFGVALTVTAFAQDPAGAPTENAPRQTTRPDESSSSGSSDTAQQQQLDQARQQQQKLDQERQQAQQEQRRKDQAEGQAQAANSQIDPQVKRVLDELKKQGVRPFGTLSVEDARRQPTIAKAVQRIMKDEKKEQLKIDKVENTDIKLSDAQLDGRIYRPEGAGPFPVILYIHGGGWVVGSLDSYDSSARSLCKAANALVISTEYRKAPESKFPAAHNDVFGAYQWVMQNAGRWSGDGKRVALVGESAGGNMAVACSMMAKDQKMQMPIHQVLIYPVADTKMDTPSYREQAEAEPLSAAKMKWFFDQTFSNQEDRNNPKIALLQAPDLKGLPSTTVITAQIDPLRSEGEALFKKLQADGVPVQYRNFDGMTHEFFSMSPVVDKANEAVQFAAENLKEAFAGRGQQAKSSDEGTRSNTPSTTSGAGSSSGSGPVGGAGSGAGGTGTSGAAGGGVGR